MAGSEAPAQGESRREQLPPIAYRYRASRRLYDWHAVIGDPNQADAICDRLLHDAHRIELEGRSMRRTHRAPKTRAATR